MPNSTQMMGVVQQLFLDFVQGELKMKEKSTKCIHSPSMNDKNNIPMKLFHSSSYTNALNISPFPKLSRQQTKLESHSL